MGSGGGDPISKAVTNFIDISTQIATGGLAGFDDSNFGRGVTGDVIKEGVKEITGATAAEDANRQARERFDEEKARALAQRKESQAQTARQQLIASRLAAGVRRGSKEAGTGTTKSKSSTLGSDESDFLGL